ncbi:vWA domain-containing protein [Paraburkholderia caribensis]|uniref:MxaL protein n=1 Tax=Paraburkholderia caribensis TaxID=75105 RepID=UPI001D063DD6|nr:MxaL protein [Paraburkholderia caribensis]
MKRGARPWMRYLRGRWWQLPLASLLLAAAVLMPPFEFRRPVFRYVVTFDITQSMDVEDVAIGGKPVSRIDFAKAAMSDVLQHLPCGSEIGWSVFTNQRSLLLVAPVEVCSSYDALLSSLDQISGKMRWVNSSVIAQGGIYSAVRAATDLGHNTDVVFITDGQEAPPVAPNETTVRDIPQGLVHGWLIGVGGDQPAPIPKTNADGVRTGFWQADEVRQVRPEPGAPTVAESHEELSQLRETYLEALAGHLGFGYRRLVGPTSLRAPLMDARYAHPVPVATDIRWAPALLALVLLVWRFLPARRMVRAERPASASTVTARTRTHSAPVTAGSSQ